MTTTQMEKGILLREKIRRRERVLDLLSNGGSVGAHIRGTYENFAHGDDAYLDRSVHKACLALIRQSIQDDLDLLRKEFEAL